MKARFKLLVITLFFVLISCSTQEKIGRCLVSIELDMKINITEFTYNLISDDLKIVGEILDSTTLEPLIGSHIIVKTDDLKVANGTTTDIEGKFELKTKYIPYCLIEFSYVGYSSQTYSLKNFLQKYFENTTEE